MACGEYHYGVYLLKVDGTDLTNFVNFQIRRGVGVVSSTRRFGPVQSKRVHTMMTSNDPKLTLS